MSSNPWSRGLDCCSRCGPVGHCAACLWSRSAICPTMFHQKEKGRMNWKRTNNVPLPILCTNHIQWWSIWNGTIYNALTWIDETISLDRTCLYSAFVDSWIFCMFLWFHNSLEFHGKPVAWWYHMVSCPLEVLDVRLDWTRLLWQEEECKSLVGAVVVLQVKQLGLSELSSYRWSPGEFRWIRKGKHHDVTRKALFWGSLLFECLVQLDSVIWKDITDCWQVLRESVLRDVAHVNIEFASQAFRGMIWKRALASIFPSTGSKISALGFSRSRFLWSFYVCLSPNRAMSHALSDGSVSQQTARAEAAWHWHVRREDRNRSQRRISVVLPEGGDIALSCIGLLEDRQRCHLNKMRGILMHFVLFFGGGFVLSATLFD